MLELNRSRSTESSRFNGSVMSGNYDANRRADCVANRSADTSNIDLNKSNLSYRERWDRSRRTAPQRSNVAPTRPIAAPSSYHPQPTYASNPNVSPEKLPHKNVSSHSKDTSPNRGNTSTQWDTAPDSARILEPPSQRLDANRSAVSSGVHDGDQSIVAGSRDIMMHDPSYRVVPLQNGSARPVRDGGNQSLRDASHVTVSEQKETLWTDAPENGTAIRTRLASLAIFSILSLVLALLAMQLIFSLIHQTGSMPSNTFLTNSSYDITHEVAVAMACVVVMLDLCCVLVCAMQGMYAATLCACHHGNLGWVDRSVLVRLGVRRKRECLCETAFRLYLYTSSWFRVIRRTFFFFSFILFPLLCGVDVRWHTPPCSSVIHIISRQSLLFEWILFISDT